MELTMNRSLILAAVAAFAAAATFGSALAAPANLSTDDDVICLLLEAAGESNCAEYELVQSTKTVSTLLPAPSLADGNEATGSIGANNTNGAPAPKTVPVRR